MQMFRETKLPDRERSWESAKTSKSFRDELNQCHSEGVIRASRERVRENVKGRGLKPVTIKHRMSHIGQLVKWGSFDPHELVLFMEPVNMPIYLKHWWPSRTLW